MSMLILAFIGLIFGKKGIIKNLFHKSKQPINIHKVDIKRTVLSSKEAVW